MKVYLYISQIQNKSSSGRTFFSVLRISPPEHPPFVSIPRRQLLSGVFQLSLKIPQARRQVPVFPLQFRNHLHKICVRGVRGIVRGIVRGFYRCIINNPFRAVFTHKNIRFDRAVFDSSPDGSRVYSQYFGRFFDRVPHDKHGIWCPGLVSRGLPGSTGDFTEAVAVRVSRTRASETFLDGLFLANQTVPPAGEAQKASPAPLSNHCSPPPFRGGPAGALSRAILAPAGPLEVL